MKKVITILCLAAAPIIFAQEKAAKADLSVKTEHPASVDKNIQTDKIEKEQHQANKNKAVAERKKINAIKSEEKSKAATLQTNKNRTVESQARSSKD